VQEPLTSLQDDVAATKRIIDLQPGPCILVAHSYGGTVITEAGTDPHVIGLVFIAAREPDAGETEASNGKRFPRATSKTNAIEKTHPIPAYRSATRASLGVVSLTLVR
jgi:predicted alpha/beta hydrolase family esterase